jgi:hypothetical protein
MVVDKALISVDTSVDLSKMVVDKALNGVDMTPISTLCNACINALQRRLGLIVVSISRSATCILFLFDARTTETVNIS